MAAQCRQPLLFDNFGLLISHYNLKNYGVLQFDFWILFLNYRLYYYLNLLILISENVAFIVKIIAGLRAVHYVAFCRFNWCNWL